MIFKDNKELNEYLEALENVKMCCSDGLQLPQNQSIEQVNLIGNSLIIIEKALQRLESIDNANPSEALECLEDIYRNGVFISDYDALGKQHPTNISPETNKSISEQCETIKQALIKSQEQEVDIIHYKGTVDNLRRDNAILKEIKNEQEKVLKIIFEKEVDIYVLRVASSVEHYNNAQDLKKLTQEEFNTLKRWTERKEVKENDL